MQTLDLQTNASKRKEEQRRRRNGRGKRKASRAKAHLNNLPQEIVLDILSRLPLKSLARSMCVSKQWRSLIEGYAKGVRRQKVLAKTCLKNGSLSLLSIDREGSVESRRPWEKTPSCSFIGILGSCDGLLLLRIKDDLFLWNPLTRYSKKVLAFKPLSDDGYGIVSGLCFDSLNNDYKAVMAFSHESPDYDGEFVVVVSFRSKVWTRVQFPYRVWTLKSGPVLKENLHWFASNKKADADPFLSTHQIVSFDPRIDKFEKVPMPQPKQGDGDIILGLGALDGCLFMARFDHPSNFEGNVEVMAMKEYGMESSWTVMFIVSNLTRLFSPFDQLVPLCSTKNDEVIMKICLGYNENHIWAYNSNDNSHRNIPFPANHHYLINAVMYEESLVTPPAYDWEEDELRGEATYVKKFLSRVRCCWKYLDLEQYEHSGSEKLESESDSDSELSEELVSESEQPDLE